MMAPIHTAKSRLGLATGRSDNNLRWREQGAAR